MGVNFGAIGLAEGLSSGIQRAQQYDLQRQQAKADVAEKTAVAGAETAKGANLAANTAQTVALTPGAVTGQATEQQLQQSQTNATNAKAAGYIMQTKATAQAINMHKEIDPIIVSTAQQKAALAKTNAVAAATGLHNSTIGQISKGQITLVAGMSALWKSSNGNIDPNTASGMVAAYNDSLTPGEARNGAIKSLQFQQNQQDPSDPMVVQTMDNGKVYQLPLSQVRNHLMGTLIATNNIPYIQLKAGNSMFNTLTGQSVGGASGVLPGTKPQYARILGENFYRAFPPTKKGGTIETDANGNLTFVGGGGGDEAGRNQALKIAGVLAQRSNYNLDPNALSSESVNAVQWAEHNKIPLNDPRVWQRAVNALSADQSGNPADQPAVGAQPPQGAPAVAAPQPPAAQGAPQQQVQPVPLQQAQQILMQNPGSYQQFVAHYGAQNVPQGFQTPQAPQAPSPGAAQ